MKLLQSISVFGLGKLGACVAATLAARGFNVVGIEVDSEKVRDVNAGVAPVEEPLLAETIAERRSRLLGSSGMPERLVATKGRGGKWKRRYSIHSGKVASSGVSFAMGR